MNENTINILVVEDNPADARLIVEMLKECKSPACVLSHADRLEKALQMLKNETFDVVLLDLDLPDSKGLAGLEEITGRAPQLPVIVLTGLDDENVGLQALQKNASDYLVKGQINEHLVRRSMRYAIERKRAAEALRENEQRLRRLTGLLEAVTTGANVIIAAVDREFRYTYFNETHHLELKRITGKDARIGMSLMEVLADMPEQRQIALDLWRRALSGETVAQTLPFGDPGRYRRFYSTRHTPIRDADGSIVGAGEVTTDVTELMQAQEALRESERRFRLALKNAPVSVAAQDKDLRFIWAYNQRTVETEEVLGKTDTDLFAPEDAKRLTALKQEVMKTGREISERSWITSNGKRVFIDLFLEPLRDDAGEVIGVGIATVDLTPMKLAEEALRESEHRWHDLADAMPQMVWTCDSGGLCDFVSRQWIEYTGLPEAELLGLGWLDRIHPDDRERLTAGWNESMRTGWRFEGEFRIRRYDGVYRWYKTSAVAIRDGRNAVIKWYGSNTDVESIKQAEQRLAQANRRLELLASAAGRLLASSDPQALIVEIATRTMKFLGCDVFFNFLVDEEARRLRLNAYAGIPEAEARRIEWLDYGVTVCGCVARDGRPIVAENIQREDDPQTGLVRSYGIDVYACTPLLSEDRVVGTLSFGRRSAERFSGEELELMKAVADHIAIAIGRLHAENALREKEKDLNRAQAVARAGSWRLDVRRNELEWSNENHRIFGIPKGPPLTYETFLSAVHPDDRDYVDEKWKAALRGEGYDIEHRIIANGEVRWVRDRAEIEFTSGGELVGGFGTTQDITERKQAEEEIERSRRWLDRIAGTTPDIIFVLDIVNHRTVYVNRSMVDLLGYAPEEFGGIEDILQKAVESEDRARVAEFYRRMADARQGEVRVLTIRVLHRDGRTLWLENRVTPFSWNESGEVVEIIGIAHDVTDLKRAHEVLERDRETFERLVDERTAETIEMHRELEKAQHLSGIGMLASTVAHELRNPLGVIRTAAYNIERKKQGNALDKHLQTIMKKVDESNQIISNLLMYARIKPPTYETVRIRDLLRESIESARANTGGRSIELRDECGPVDGLTAWLDPFQITEVMNNILTNAVQAIPAERGGSVTVSAATSDGAIVIRVSDTGTGIDPEAFPHIFEPFFTSKSKGTGLGLSLCKELISLHNGSIDIESELGKGTTVTVVLPLSPRTTAHPQAPA